jgi:hypothetical protein
MEWLLQASATWAAARIHRRLLLGLYHLVNRLSNSGNSDSMAIPPQGLDSKSQAEVDRIIWSGFPLNFDTQGWRNFTRTYVTLLRQAARESDIEAA